MGLIVSSANGSSTHGHTCHKHRVLTLWDDRRGLAAGLGKGVSEIFLEVFLEPVDKAQAGRQER